MFVGVIDGVAGVLHDDELTIERSMVRALVDRTVPGCRALRLRRLMASGSSNALFRLGEELLVRLPRQPGGSVTIVKEARWLPLVGACLPVRVPDVVAVGEPGFGYPERWSLVRWIDGAPPTVADPRRGGVGSRTGLARNLAEVVRALRAPRRPAGCAGRSRVELVPRDAASDPGPRHPPGNSAMPRDHEEFEAWLAGQTGGLVSAERGSPVEVDVPD